MSSPWSENEVNILHDKWPYYTSKQISKKFLDRSPQAVREKAHREGIETQGFTRHDEIKDKPDNVVIPDDKEWEDLAPSTRHYYRNRDKGIIEEKNERRNKRKESLYIWYNTIKRENGCNICDENEPCCLVFHHIEENNKEYNISEMVARGHGVEKIREEMNKCSILCANCHRKWHNGLIEKELSKPNTNFEYRLVS